MLKSELLRANQQEIYQHDFSHFVDEPPSIAQGGRGVVVFGVSGMQKEIRNHASVFGSPGGRCDAGVVGSSVL